MRISVQGNSEGLRVRMRFAQYRRLLLTRIVLAVLAVQGAVIGLWATLAPHSWYTAFRGSARGGWRQTAPTTTIWPPTSGPSSSR
ncbi:hypothetical protein [Nocardia gipuzkoensis]